MVSKTGPRVARSNSCMGPAYPGKKPKGQTKNFGARKCYLGPNFWNLASKRSTWQPWVQCHANC